MYCSRKHLHKTHPQMKLPHKTNIKIELSIKIFPLRKGSENVGSVLLLKS